MSSNPAAAAAASPAGAGAPKRRIGRPPHKYSKYFIILDEKANRIERFAMCKACILHGSTQTKIINRKRNCRSHLRKCQFLTEEIQLTDKEGSDDEASARKSASKSAKPLPSLSAFSPISIPVIESHPKRVSFISYEESPIKEVKPSLPIVETNAIAVPHPCNGDPCAAEFENNLLRFTLANDLPFHWVENPESIKFLQYIDPSLKTRRRLIPSARVLSNRILEQASLEMEERQKDLAHDTRGITLIFDGWKNVRIENYMGLILVNSRGNVVVWDSREISTDIERTDDIIFKVEDMLGDEKLNSVNIIGVVMDSSNAFSNARQQLRRKYWRITWIPCFAHQVLLCITDVFCIFKHLHAAMFKGLRIVEYFNKSPFYQEKLKAKQSDMYGKVIPLVHPSLHNLSSFLSCISSLLSSKAAIQAISFDSEMITFSDTMFQLNQAILPLPLEEDIASAAMDAVFWNHLALLKELLHPFVTAYHQLQSGFYRLPHITHSFGLFVQLFTAQSPSSNLISQLDVTERSAFLNRLERRWKEWEHPILILAYFLHPKYINTNFSKESRINTPTLGEWALKYYQIWFHQQPKQLLGEMQKYQSQKDYPFTPEVSQQFYSSDVLDYWDFVSPVVPELCKFATRLLSLTVTSSSCYRLFDDLGSLQNKYRMRLDRKKALNINKIKSDIVNVQKETTRDLASLKKAVAGLGGNGDMLMNDAALIDTLDIKGKVAPAMDRDEDNLQPFTSIEEWQKIINGWIKLLEDENMGLDATLDVTQNKNEFLHPADDPLGKWPLEKLFGVTLQRL